MNRESIEYLVMYLTFTNKCTIEETIPKACQNINLLQLSTDINSFYTQGCSFVNNSTVVFRNSASIYHYDYIINDFFSL